MGTASHHHICLILSKPIHQITRSPLQVNMSFFKTVSLLVLGAAFAVATTAEEASQQCGNNQQIACCNSGAGSFLGLNCLSVPVLAVPIEQACGSNQAACCNNDQNGNINVQASCNPIAL